MDFPSGFPDRLKPRAEAAIVRASRRVPNSQDMMRMEAGFYAFANTAVKAAEDGEYDVALAHAALGAFLDYLFRDDPCAPAMFRLSAAKTPVDITDEVKSDIRRSPKWVRYMERLDAITRKDERAKGKKGQQISAKTRRGIVMPILKEKGMSRSQWADRAGVDPSVVYDYLEDKSTPRPENRKALAKVLGLEDLPETENRIFPKKPQYSPNKPRRKTDHP